MLFLERVSVQEPSDAELQEDIELIVHSLIQNFPASPSALKEFRSKTSSDVILRHVMQVILTGKFVNNIETQSQMKHFQSLASDLCPIDSIIFYKKTYCSLFHIAFQYADKLHEGHRDVQKMKAKAKQILYWRGMDADIEA